jgi:transcriptional regulator with XRE-family HTH domain
MSIRLAVHADAPHVPLGDMLIKARKASGLSQVAVARALSVHATTVLGWERGYRQPHVDMIDAYLKVVGGSITLGVLA